MPGEPDPLYVKARRALLDAVEALSGRRESIVLVGAQAIYVHAGAAKFAVADYTTDADLVVEPRDLSDQPLLSELLGSGGFESGAEVGRWVSREGVFVDLLVPDALAGSGRRGARLGPHGNRIARKARGLEGAHVRSR